MYVYIYRERFDQSIFKVDKIHNIYIINTHGYEKFMATASILRGVTHETGSSGTCPAKTEKGAAGTLWLFHSL